jgi:voltage-dependent anion channel protein 2
LTVTQAWTTSNILRNVVEVEDQIAKGVKFDLSTSLSPDKGAKTAVLNAAIKQSGFHTRASLDVFKVCSFRSVLFTF